MVLREILGDLEPGEGNSNLGFNQHTDDIVVARFSLSREFQGHNLVYLSNIALFRGKGLDGYGIARIKCYPGASLGVFSDDA